jgi:hypothetical protein
VGDSVLINPLKGLPPLPKYHHMSGDYNLYTFNAVGARCLPPPRCQVHTATKLHILTGNTSCENILVGNAQSFNDDLVYDLTRITGAAPLELGYYNAQCQAPCAAPACPCNAAADAAVKQRVRGAVAACARVSRLGGREAIISMNWSPWMWKFRPQRDPTSKLREAEELVRRNYAPSVFLAPSQFQLNFETMSRRRFTRAKQ